jgi:hypothetical protein
MSQEKTEIQKKRKRALLARERGKALESVSDMCRGTWSEHLEKRFGQPNRENGVISGCTFAKRIIQKSFNFLENRK